MGWEDFGWPGLGLVKLYENIDTQTHTYEDIDSVIEEKSMYPYHMLKHIIIQMYIHLLVHPSKNTYIPQSMSPGVRDSTFFCVLDGHGLSGAPKQTHAARRPRHWNNLSPSCSA